MQLWRPLLCYCCALAALSYPRPEGRTFKCPGFDDHGAIIVIIVIKTTVITVVMMTIVIGQHRYDQKLQCPEYSYTVPKC